MAITGALATLVWGAAANAACTNLANTADPACKAAQKCQNEIVKRATAYYAAVQKAHTNAISKSLTGKQTKKPVYMCVGGTRNRLSCLHNNGVCKSTINKGKFCNSDTDCDGSVGSCDRSRGCNPTDPNDTNECAVFPALSDFGKDISKAKVALRSKILAKCNTAPTASVPVADIGMNGNPNCFGAFSAPTQTRAYEALIECITKSVDGDFDSAKVVDTQHRLFEKIVGSSTTAPPQQAPGKESTSPYMLVGIQGAQMFQFGAGTFISAPGSLTPLSAASCSTALGGTGTGNGNVGCTTDADCGKDGAGVNGNCKLNGLSSCPSFSPNCTRLSATMPVKANGVDGNTLGVTETCASTLAYCLVNRTKNSGNGTAASGGINFATGELVSTSLTATDIYATGVAIDCGSFHVCPRCTAGLCDAGPNVGGMCSGDGPTIECPPSGSPSATLSIKETLSTESKTLTANGSNKFCGFCESLPNNQDGACNDGVAHPNCSNGCSFSYTGGADQECIDKLGAGHVCDFGATAPGLPENPSVTQITVGGTRSHYTPVLSGLSCLGSTGSPVLDGILGLPGPVRMVVPQTNLWVHTTN
jgi:hypothetical protein